MIYNGHPLFSPIRRHRGSVLLLVLSMLAILTLIATSLVYLSRLETQASSNAAKRVQDRMAAYTGVTPAVKAIAPVMGQPVSYTQTWANTSRKSDFFEKRVVSTREGVTDEALKQNSPPLPSSPWLKIDDCSARININAVKPYPDMFPGAKAREEWLSDGELPPEVLENLIARALREKGIEASASSITRTLIQARYGPDGVPGSPENIFAPEEEPEKNAMSVARKTRFGQAPSADLIPDESAGVSTAELDTTAREEESASDKDRFKADFRQRPNGDDTPYIYVEDIRGVPGISQEVYEAIAPYLTTFSISYDIWYDDSRRAFARIPLNQADRHELHGALTALYPDQDTNLLMQFALNIIDRRDEDNIPSAHVMEDQVLPMLGYEATPIISEVCPDVITFEEDGDNGEYIEIFNPLNENVNLRGWQIDWGYGRYTINEILPPQGILILTDDIDDKNDPTPEDNLSGMGSFVKIFQMMPATPQFLLVEQVGMDIPNDAGVIRLYDDSNNLIDYLVYTKAQFQGNHFGYHKENFFSHTGSRKGASPFAVKMDKPETEYDLACWQIMQSLRNTPFESPVDVLFVPVPPAFRAQQKLNLQQASRQGTIRNSADLRTEAQWFPDYAITENLCPDLRMIDMFAVDPFIDKDKNFVKSTYRPAALKSFSKEYFQPMFAKDSDTMTEQLASLNEEDLPPTSIGKINLNTAPVAVIASMPGFEMQHIQGLIRYRNAFQDRLLEGSNSGDTLVLNPMDSAPFRSLSDFASNSAVWGNSSPINRLTALRRLSPIVTFNSTTFSVSSSNAASEKLNGVPISHAACKSVFNISASGIDVLDWRYKKP